MPQPPPDEIPATISTIRRKLIAVEPEVDEEPVDEEAVEFEPVGASGLVFHGSAQGVAPPPSPRLANDDVDAMLERYQAEKGLSMPETEPVRVNGSMPAPRRSAAMPELRMPGSQNGIRNRNGRTGLPPLTTAANAELERLRAENEELKQMVGEYREVFEEHNPEQLEAKLAESEKGIAEREEQNILLQLQVEEWTEKFKTHRFVPRDEELAREADELDKERAIIAKDRKKIELERVQLKDDEESLMKQMREMEVGMAKDRADLARQRTELQRLHAEVKHELEQLQRGDVNMKERLSLFQRRHQEVSTRTAAPPTQSAPVAPAPVAAAPVAAQPRPRESGVFRLLFGQGN